jgi:hypothetical protein
MKKNSSYPAFYHLLIEVSKVNRTIMFQISGKKYKIWNCQAKKINN